MNHYNHLRVNRVQDVLFVTLNCPDTRNALSPEVTAELYRVSAFVQTDAALRAIVLRGSQGFFCAGGNIGSFQSRLDAHQQTEPAQDPIAARNREFGKFLELWSALPVPIIAAVEGAAMGGGMGLAAALLVMVRTIGMFELTFFTAGPSSQTLVVALYYGVFSTGVRPPQAIDAMAVMYMAITLVFVLIALRFVSPTQLVSRVKEAPREA